MSELVRERAMQETFCMTMNVFLVRGMKKCVREE